MTKRLIRTSSAREPRAGRLVLVGVWLTLALAGCHGGAQSDIVERELRWQEDQIYAMEDYISDYQQLLCQYRSENSALKRQLGYGHQKENPERQIRRDDQRIQDTEEIIREFDQPAIQPGVPSLMDTLPGGSGASQRQEFGPDLEFRPARRSTPGVRRTVLEQRLDQPQEQLEESWPEADSLALDEAFAVELQQVPEEADDSPEPLQHVVVRGDVLPPDDDQTGPRLLVNVEPLGGSGGPAEFAGGLSLMILDTSGEKPRGIARWDFSPEQLTELLGEELGPTMEFPLQLPADTPTDLPLQIWVRLVPADGEKVLAHSILDLQQPGPFSSVRPQPIVLQQEVVQSEPRAEVENEPVTFSMGDWNGWQVARPDQLGDDSANRRPSESRWRKATQPIPTMVNQGRPVVVAATESNPTGEDRVARRAKATDVKPPAWSPDRSGDSVKPSADVSPPAWSPER
jgi:hypothetical protein